jgi:hypothetical protein
MQQTTSRQLYAYWDRVRNGRAAPRRFEIEPGKIAPLLPDTFIAECERTFSYRFRLAGTRICEQFGRELRGADLLGLFEAKDRHVFSSLLRHVVSDAAVGHLLFIADSDAGRRASFELLVMPLIHTGTAIDRLLGAISAIEPPFWLGSAPLIHLELTDLHLIWPDGEPKPASTAGTASAAELVNLARRRFRVYQGGAD